MTCAVFGTMRIQRENGFTLVEALVAMVVISAGLLALAGMQAGLTRNTDVSRQKSEATRLAQEKIEKIRSYSQIHSVAGSFSWTRFGWESLNSGSDNASSNATFTRTWTIGGTATDAQRPVSVNVEWTDRTGQVQSVLLNSVVSKNDPAFSGSVGFPLPHNNNIKQPKNRSLSIPVPAIRLANGLSSYQIDTDYALIFSDNTGFVVKQCDTMVTVSTDLETCANFIGYVLSGYVSKAAGSAWPHGVDLAGLTGLAGIGSAGAQSKCKWGPAYDLGSGATLSDFYFYVCVLAVPTEGDTWGGTIRLSGIPDGSTVCRYQYAGTSAIDNNQRNLQPYSNVKQSLNNQNYLVFKPTGRSSADTCPEAQDTDSFQTTLHQDCRASNANRARDCPASAVPF